MTTPKEEAQKALLWLTIATVALFLSVAGISVYFYIDASHSRQALCTLRGDLEQRVQSSRDFLRDHPKGIPGIPIATIKQGIDNQQRTIDALSSLSC
jgi:hypothetical protein